MKPFRKPSNVISRGTQASQLAGFTRWRKLTSLLACMLLIFVLFGLVQHVTAFSHTMKKGDCLSILRETGSRIGAQGDEVQVNEDWNEQVNNFTCSLVLEKTIDERGPIMGQGFFYHEYTGIYIIPNDTTSIKPIQSAADNLVDKQSTSFHGFPAIYSTQTACEEGCMESFEWLVHDLGLQFSMMRINYEIPEGEVRSRGIPFDIFAMAESFYQVAYAHMPDAGLPEPDSGKAPGGDSDTFVMENPAVDETGGDMFGVPFGIFLLSIGLPVAGAVTGAGISAILTALSNTASAASTVYQRAVFTERFNQIIQQKIKDGYYIKNPTFAKNPDSPEFLPILKEGKDATVSFVTGSPDLGGRCGEATQWGKQWLEGPAKEIFGNETIIGNIDITREGYFERWDVNHTSVKIILPSGERLVPDVHESLIAGRAVVYDEADWIRKYANIIGGKVIVEYSGAEGQVINDLNVLGSDAGAAHIKKSDGYSEKPGYYDLLIKSFGEHPPVKPVPVEKHGKSTGLEG